MDDLARAGKVRFVKDAVNGLDASRHRVAGDPPVVTLRITRHTPESFLLPQHHKDTTMSIYKKLLKNAHPTNIESIVASWPIESKPDELTELLVIYYWAVQCHNLLSELKTKPFGSEMTTNGLCFLFSIEFLEDLNIYDLTIPHIYWKTINLLRQYSRTCTNRYGNKYFPYIDKPRIWTPQRAILAIKLQESLDFIINILPHLTECYITQATITFLLTHPEELTRGLCGYVFHKYMDIYKYLSTKIHIPDSPQHGTQLKTYLNKELEKYKPTYKLETYVDIPGVFSPIRREICENILKQTQTEIDSCYEAIEASTTY